MASASDGGKGEEATAGADACDAVEMPRPAAWLAVGVVQALKRSTLMLNWPRQSQVAMLQWQSAIPFIPHKGPYTLANSASSERNLLIYRFVLVKVFVAVLAVIIEAPMYSALI
eukprot:Opistho-1_new@103424